MAAGDPVGKRAIEAHVEAHVGKLSPAGAFFTVPTPGEELVQIQAYAHPAGHWHFVTYGFTSLYAGSSPADLRGPDGYGYELTYSVPRDGDAPPTDAVTMLLSLARGLVARHIILAPGHSLPLAGPIAAGSVHTGFAIHGDPDLPSLTTPLGHVDMLQLVGVTPTELELCAAGSTFVLLDRLSALDRWLVTRHDRVGLTSL